MNHPFGRDSESIRSYRMSVGLLTATVINCALQGARFWRFRAHEITLDGINYVGLARHLMDGDFKASLHAYWSPLTSWLIAACGLLSKNFSLMGKLVTLGSFLVSLLLLYLLTLRQSSSCAGCVLVFNGAGNHFYGYRGESFLRLPDVFWQILFSRRVFFFTFSSFLLFYATTVPDNGCGSEPSML